MVFLQIYETSGHMAESGLKSIIHSPSTFLWNAMGKFQQCHIGDGLIVPCLRLPAPFPRERCCHSCCSLRNAVGKRGLLLWWNTSQWIETATISFIHGLTGYHLKHPEMVRTAGQQRNWWFAKQFCWGCCPTKPHLASVACGQFCPLGQAKGSDLPSFCCLVLL